MGGKRSVWEDQWLQGAPAMMRRPWGDQRVGGQPGSFTVAQRQFPVAWPCPLTFSLFFLWQSLM